MGGRGPVSFLCALGAALWLATSAAAVPITTTVQWDGQTDNPLIIGDAQGFGVTEATALASGLPILVPGMLAQATGLEIGQTLDPFSILTGPPGEATSSWTVTNNTGIDLIGDVYLVFAKPIENTITVAGMDVDIEYDPSDVGLTLENGTGGDDWVLIEAFDTDGVDPDYGTLYYPAVSLGSLLIGDTSDAFSVRYVLDNPQVFLDTQGFELGIPRWQILAAFTPIPEPSTALLVALGLGAFALVRRRRP